MARPGALKSGMHILVIVGPVGLASVLFASGGRWVAFHQLAYFWTLALPAFIVFTLIVALAVFSAESSCYTTRPATVAWWVAGVVVVSLWLSWVGWVLTPSFGPAS